MENKISVKPLKEEDINSILNDGKFVNELGINQCIVYNYDSLVFGDLDEVIISPDNIMEGRFFNDEYEITLIKEGQGFKGFIFKEDCFDECSILREKRYIYYKKGTEHRKYRAMEVKKYIEYDNDGQAYISMIKPCRFLRGDE